METGICKGLCNLNHFRFILAVHGNQYGAFQRKTGLCCLLGLIEGFAIGIGKSEHFTGRTHFRPEDRIYLREHIEGE